MNVSLMLRLLNRNYRHNIDINIFIEHLQILLYRISQHDCEPLCTFLIPAIHGPVYKHAHPHPPDIGSPPPDRSRPHINTGPGWRRLVCRISAPFVSANLGRLYREQPINYQAARRSLPHQNQCMARAKDSPRFGGICSPSWRGSSLGGKLCAQAWHVDAADPKCPRWIPDEFRFRSLMLS